MNPFTGACTAFGWRATSLEANRGFEQLRVQGILVLADSGPSDGGFFCVPGSHKHIEQWAASTIASTGKDKLQHLLQMAGGAGGIQFQLQEGDALKSMGTKVPCRAGMLCIWNSMLLHANYPNDSSRPRMVQYIKMKPAACPAFAPLFTRRELLPAEDEFRLTELGEKLP